MDDVACVLADAVLGDQEPEPAVRDEPDVNRFDLRRPEERTAVDEPEHVACRPVMKPTLTSRLEVLGPPFGPLPACLDDALLERDQAVINDARPIVLCLDLPAPSAGRVGELFAARPVRPASWCLLAVEMAAQRQAELAADAALIALCEVYKAISHRRHEQHRHGHRLDWL